MHILLDARLAGTTSGIGRYIRELIYALDTLEHRHHFTLLTLPQDEHLFRGLSKRFYLLKRDIPWYGIQEQKELPKILYFLRPHVVHFPHWNIPLLWKGNFVVTLHDLTPLHFSSYRATTRALPTYWFKQFILKKILRKATREAQHIITVSEFSKRDIAQTLAVPLERISVTYEDAESQRVDPHDLYPQTQNALIQKPYFLYVGSAYPHKNLEFLIYSFAAWNKGMYQLVLVGETDYFYKRLQKKTTPEVIFFGKTTEQELRQLYQQAMAFVTPSLYEGFGLPPLEALAHGTAVISSNAASLPEVLGDAALFFNPRMPEELAQVFSKITEPSIRETLQHKGAEQLKKYSWKKMAQETLAVYEKSAPPLPPHDETLA